MMSKLFKRIDALYICPWSLQDPLCRSQSLPYIRELVLKGYEFSLITFESGRYPLSELEVKQHKERLRNDGIRWHPVNWAPGKTISAKLLSIIAVMFNGVIICARYRPRVIHSRSSLPLFLAVFLKKIYFTKLLYDADSLLSEEYADIEYLAPGSKALKFLEWTEMLGRKNADQIIVLTNVLKQDYRERFGVETPISVIPCCVDMIRFSDQRSGRKEIRTQLGISDHELLYVYVGKSGSWYLTDELFKLFRIALDQKPSSKLLLISPDDAKNFENSAKRAGVLPSDFFVRRVSFEHVGSWMAAADIAFSLIKPVRSKRGSSPVKLAEYLASGLPVIATKGIGDVDELITQNRVGVLVDSFDDASYLSALEEVGKLGDAAERCRETAMREFDLKSVGGERYRRVYSSLMNSGDYLE